MLLGSTTVFTSCKDVPVDDGTAHIIGGDTTITNTEKDTIEWFPAHVRPIPPRAIVYLTIERYGGPLYDTLTLDLEGHLWKRMDTTANGRVKAVSLGFEARSLTPGDGVPSVANRSGLQKVEVKIPRTEVDDVLNIGNCSLENDPYAPDGGGVELVFWVNNQRIVLVTGDKVNIGGWDQKSIAEFNVVNVDSRRRRIEAKIHGLFFNKPGNPVFAKVHLDSLKVSFGY